MFTLLALATLLASPSIAPVTVPAAPTVLVSWSGGDSERTDAQFFALQDAAAFHDMWLDVVIRPGSSRSPTSFLEPRIEFTSCVAFALTAGTTWNSRGYVLDSIVEQAGAWHVRLRQDTYATKGDGDRVRPYGIFVLPRNAGATIVVDEDARERVDEPARWKERGRFVVAQPGARAPSTGALAPAAPAETAAFAPRVLDAVRDYTKFERASDVPHWAPELCRAPPAPGPLVSASDDAATHGGKLYHLFVRDRASYAPLPADARSPTTPGAPLVPAPVGQVIVKESWQATLADAPKTNEIDADHATRDGHMYSRGEQRELFVMLKLDPATPGTDTGWIYATVTPDRTRVTAAGRIASCMACHTKASSDRQFGLPRDWESMRREAAPR